MRRFAQKDKNNTNQQQSWEAKQLLEEQKKIEAFLASEKDIIAFCKDLSAAGTALKLTASKIPSSYFLASAALSFLGDKLIKSGDDTVSFINARKTAVLAFQTTASLTPIFQPTSKTPGLKRYIPFVGDVLNYKYTQTLSYQKDLINPIEQIFAPFKCDKSHPPTKAPVTIFLAPNFFHHPELDDQYRAKTEAVSQLSFNLGAQLQNIEALLAWIATAFGQIELVAAIRAIGGAVQTLLMIISAIFSPNTADLATYGFLENFQGGGLDPDSPLGFLNKVPGFLQYAKKFEAKPIAEETKAASEKLKQNFILLDVFDNKIKFKDQFGEEKIMKVGDTWPKYGITITYIDLTHAEYKDKYGNKYSMRRLQPAFATTEPSISDIPGTTFYKIMKDVADLRSSGVNGDVNKLLSKKISFIMSLVFQLKNKYPWIGDTKNAKWVNLQADILTHNTRPFPKTIIKKTPPKKQQVYRSPVNPNQTPREKPWYERGEDLPPL